ISPHDPRLVLVACDMTGAYISHDGGDSWRMFNLRSPVTLFAFDSAGVRAAPEAARARVDNGGVGRIESEKSNGTSQVEHAPGVATIMRNIGSGHIAGYQDQPGIMRTYGRIELRSPAAWTKNTPGIETWS